MLILGQTSNSWYLCCANMVVIVYLCLYFEKIMMPMVIIHELNATDCVRCLLFIFCHPLKVIQTADIKDYHSRMLHLIYTGLIVNVKMNIAVMRKSVLPCPYHWNSLRAVLIRASPCAIRSVTFSKLCHLPFLSGYKSCFFLQDQMFSISLGICHGNQ